MTFNPEEHLKILEARLREFGHPRADPIEARAALERALSQAPWELSNFRAADHARPKTLYAQLSCNVELAKLAMQQQTTARR
jgi:hypothetical protein